MLVQTRRKFIAYIAALPFVAASAKGAKAGTNHKVTINGFSYSPSSLKIKVGDTVRWTNRDMAKHTATDIGKKWTTGNLKNSDSGKVTFTAAGNFNYTCKYHPKMKGRITVSA